MHNIADIEQRGGVVRIGSGVVLRLSVSMVVRPGMGVVMVAIVRCRAVENPCGHAERSQHQ